MRPDEIESLLQRIRILEEDLETERRRVVRLRRYLTNVNTHLNGQCGCLTVTDCIKVVNAIMIAMDE